MRPSNIENSYINNIDFPKTAQNIPSSKEQARFDKEALSRKSEELVRGLVQSRLAPRIGKDIWVRFSTPSEDRGFNDQRRRGQAVDIVVSQVPNLENTPNDEVRMEQELPLMALQVTTAKDGREAEQKRRELADHPFVTIGVKKPTFVPRPLVYISGRAVAEMPKETNELSIQDQVEILQSMVASLKFIRMKTAPGTDAFIKVENLIKSIESDISELKN